AYGGAGMVECVVPVTCPLGRSRLLRAACRPCSRGPARAGCAVARRWRRPGGGQGATLRPVLRFNPLFQSAGPPVLAQRSQVNGEIVGRREGAGVVVAEHPAPAGQGVGIEFAGPLIIT